MVTTGKQYNRRKSGSRISCYLEGKIGSYKGDLGVVGAGFWRGFMNRNKDKVNSKKGKKNELDCASKQTYENFSQIYEGVIT